MDISNLGFQCLCPWSSLPKALPELLGRWQSVWHRGRKEQLGSSRLKPFPIAGIFPPCSNPQAQLFSFRQHMGAAEGWCLTLRDWWIDFDRHRDCSGSLVPPAQEGKGLSPIETRPGFCFRAEQCGKTVIIGQCWQKKYFKPVLHL